MLGSRINEFKMKNRSTIQILFFYIIPIDILAHIGCGDIKATYRFVVYSGKEAYALTPEIMVMPLPDMMQETEVINK